MIKTHRPLLSITLAFFLGITLDYFCPLQIGWGIGLGMVLLAVLGAIQKYRAVSAMVLLVLFIDMGAIRAHSQRLEPSRHIDSVFGNRKVSEVILEGTVISDVESRPYFKRKKTMFTLNAERLTMWGKERETTGKVLVQIFRPAPVRFGDVVRLEGKIYRPFDFSDEKFSYRDYLARREIYLIMSVGKQGRFEVVTAQKGFSIKAGSYYLKDKLKNIFMENLTPNEAAIMVGMILGDRFLIPKHINELFAQTGTAHILAISGFNVGIVAFIVFLAVKPLFRGRRMPYLMTMIFLIFYAFLTGGQSSVVRATIMAAVFLLGFTLERETEPLNSLALAALLILAFKPLSLFEVGFQLSFVCVLSIFCLVPMVLEIFPRRLRNHESSVVQFFLQSFGISLAVWIGVAGLIVYYFQIVTPITILANLVIIPLSTALIVLGIGMLAAAFVWIPMVSFFAPCIKVTLNLMIGSIYLFSQCPWAYFYVLEVPGWSIIVYYGILIGVLIFYWMRRTPDPETVSQPQLM